MIRQILLVRHGETNGNKQGIVQMPETPLNHHGRLQAQRVARRVAEQCVREQLAAEILTSDYERAQHTAQSIADACEVGLDTTPLLRERNFGTLRGQYYDDIRKLRIEPFAPDYEPPGGETWARFDARVADAWREITARASAQRDRPTLLVCVTHGFVLRRLAANHLTLPDGQGVPERWANTSVTSVEPAEPFRVLTLGDDRHLDDASFDDATAVSGI